MRALRHLIPLALAFAACSDEPTRITPGQVLLYFDTDAPLPAGPGQRRSLATPLFDRLRVDVIRPGEDNPCPECTNEFEMNALVMQQRQASIGIAPVLGASGYRARVRLFRADFTNQASEPNADSTIDVTVELPVVTGDATLERNVFLPIEEVGRPLGTAQSPTPPALGRPARSRVGTWPGAERVDCAGSPPPGAVCVPGGAYWMGHPNAPGFTPKNYELAPRLVVLSPFFMSATEVTVSQYRAAGQIAAQSWSGLKTGNSGGDWCTFTPEPGAFEALPINCVALDDAERYCALIGGELPTEAQFEYVAGGLVGNTFPWGRDIPTCSDATFGRGGWGILEGVESPCKQEAPGSPSPPGAGARDRLDLPGGTLFDLAGNMTEWMRDRWNRIDEPCWSPSKLLRDPVCTNDSPSDGALAVHRGGNWVEVPNYMIAFARYPRAGTFHNVQTGFRCVWPAR